MPKSLVKIALSNKDLLLNTIAPPSTVLGKRTVWKENTDRSVPKFPVYLPLYFDPKASTQSSITGIPNSLATALISST